MRDDIKEKGLSTEEVYDRATQRGISTPQKSWNKRKKPIYKCECPAVGLLCTLYIVQPMLPVMIDRSTRQEIA